MAKKDSIDDLVFDEVVEENTKILTNEEVLFTVSYLSGGDDVCSEAFFTKRFAAEMAMAEAKKAEEDTWIDIVENGTNKELLVGTFKVSSTLVSMKIMSKDKIMRDYEEFHTDDVEKS